MKQVISFTALTAPAAHMIGLAVWEGAWWMRSWPMFVHLLVVAALAVATIDVFLPRGI